VIVEYIRYTLVEHDGEEFVSSYERAADSLRAAPNALAWELARCTEDPKSFILRIEWDSAEGHMQGFRRGEHFPAFFAAIRPYVGEITEMRHYQATRVASA
jgi:hemoglobin